jgi:predicted Zn-dependent peptidase
MTTSVLPPRPAVAPPARWRFPAARQHRLDNGLAVYLHHMPGQHVATVRCHLGVPAETEPGDRTGICAVMAASLNCGTSDVTARRFEQLTGSFGVAWDTSPGWAGPAITLDVTAGRLPAALHLLGTALARPSFEPAEVAGRIQLAAAGYMHGAASPQTRVRQHLPSAIYGSTSRAGRGCAGTPATLAQLTPADIAGFYDAHVRPANTIVVIAGDLSGLDGTALAAQALGTWQDPRPVQRPAPAPLPQPRPATALLLDEPGADQTHLLLAVPVPGRGHPGWNELHIAARILGAPLSGHLDARLRESTGHSYGLRAELTELVTGAGLFLISGAIATQATISALTDITSILTAPLTAGFDPGEHATATEAILAMTPLGCETPAQLTAVTASLAASGLPADFTDIVTDDIAALTPREVSRAYQTCISPGQITLIAAGDAATLIGPLQDLPGTAPLQVIST